MGVIPMFYVIFSKTHRTFVANGQRKVFQWNLKKRWRLTPYMVIQSSCSKINIKERWYGLLFHSFSSFSI